MSDLKLTTFEQFVNSKDLNSSNNDVEARVIIRSIEAHELSEAIYIKESAMLSVDLSEFIENSINGTPSKTIIEIEKALTVALNNQIQEALEAIEDKVELSCMENENNIYLDNVERAKSMREAL